VSKPFLILVNWLGSGQSVTFAPRVLRALNLEFLVEGTPTAVAVSCDWTQLIAQTRLSRSRRGRACASDTFAAEGGIVWISMASRPQRALRASGVGLNNRICAIVSAAHFFRLATCGLR